MLALLPTSRLKSVDLPALELLHIALRGGCTSKPDGPLPPHLLASRAGGSGPPPPAVGDRRWGVLDPPHSCWSLVFGAMNRRLGTEYVPGSPAAARKAVSAPGEPQRSGN